MTVVYRRDDRDDRDARDARDARYNGRFAASRLVRSHGTEYLIAPHLTSLTSDTCARVLMTSGFAERMRYKSYARDARDARAFFPP